ncbi:galactose-1-phosphate uridylyltransferase [Candidatus Solincola sp.]|nr:galactose-1-phosphate uridylyltransferase [Actinomycetota bacterium]MDI7251372.1 galactose-1-phosphate uridylyltransferase [Actinomycetota bacterium]
MVLGDDHPELRRDALAGGWTIVAPARSRRPGGGRGTGSQKEPCPFCPGNEHLTPPEVWAESDGHRRKDGPGWNIRVVPNLYPALEASFPPGRGRGGRRVLPAQGFHEVIIHSPRHDLSLARMDPESAYRLMRAYRLRHRALCGHPRIKQVLVILNHGREAGASLEHPHTQVFALPLVPRAVREELGRWRRAGDRGCPLCAAVEEARREGRMVLENPTFAALAPYASRQPYETWFVPLRHRDDFSWAGETELRGMADALCRALRGMAELLGDPPYNLWLHSAPCDGADHAYYHWHLELIPRLAVTAGFEMASGLFINPVPPEEAARRLREVVR